MKLEWYIKIIQVLIKAEGCYYSIAKIVHYLCS